MVTKELVDIGTHLRLVSFGIECAHGVGIQQAALREAIDDAQPDPDGGVDCSAKHYVFRDVGGVRVTGDVDEHEPEDIWLVVDGHRKLERDLARIVALASCYVDQIATDSPGA